MTIRYFSVLACVALAWPLLGQGGFEGPGRYEIMNLKSGKVLDLDRNDQTTVIQFSSRGADNQTWDIRPARGGFFYFRNGMNGFALDAGGGGRSEPVRGVPFNGGDSQQWRVEAGKDGNALIVSRFGRTLDIPDGSSRDGLQVQVYDLNGDSNQRFTLRRVARRNDWDWDRDRGRDDRGGGTVINCSSNHGERVYCAADTSNGIRMVQQISGSPCVEGRTWGFNERGIWVDRGCRADFAVNPPRGAYGGSAPITCSSNTGGRVFCEVDTRGMAVQLSRQISGSPCRQGETWGWDRRGIWVDRGCRAEFVLVPGR